MARKWLTDEPGRAAEYEVLAGFYDHLMQHVDYRHWTVYVLKLLKKIRHEPGEILEIACGTGSILHELYKRGHEAFGADRSLQMVRIAADKLAKFNGGSRVFQADIGSLPLRRPFDTVVCLYDSLNYCETETDLRAVVTEVLRCLRSGGVFIFDLCTEYNCIRNFDAKISSSSSDRYFYTRRSYYIEKKRQQVNDFLITKKDSGEVWKEHHVQRIFDIAAVHRMLGDLNFGRIETYKNYTTKPPDAATERVHFLLRKD